MPDVFEFCLKLQDVQVLRFCCLSAQTKLLRHLTQHHLRLTSDHVVADATSHCNTGSDTWGSVTNGWLTAIHSLAHCFITHRDEGNTMCWFNSDINAAFTYGSIVNRIAR